MKNQEKNKKIYNLAKEYLLSFEGVTEHKIDTQIKGWERSNNECISDICKRMILTARNRGAMPNSIGDLTKISQFLFNYDPIRILENYSNWEELFDEIERNYTPPGPMDKDNKKNYWVQFTKSIISISKFLKRFKDIKEFNDFVEVFYHDEETRVALPLLLEKEIFGFKFALACDFLKEAGYPEYIKTDTHIKDIFMGLGLTEEEEDYQIFKDVIRYAESINEKPYEVDKLLWLVGSGKFYLFEDENGNEFEINTSKDEFIEKVQDKLN